MLLLKKWLLRRKYKRILQERFPGSKITIGNLDISKDIFKGGSLNVRRWNGTEWELSQKIEYK